MKKIIIVFVCLFSKAIFSQDKADDNARLFTICFQLRPILPAKFLGTGDAASTGRTLTSIISTKPGYTFGMQMRRGFTSKFAIETGINYIKRNYWMKITNDSMNITDKSDFGIVSYEIPIQGLIYVRLGKQLFMNNSLGVSINWFASEVASTGKDNRFSQYTYLNRYIFNPALLANVGFEYRTPKSGFYYIGASLHRPFTYNFFTIIKYDNGPYKYTNTVQLSGSFLTIDLRYFFHEKPIKKKMQKTKTKKSEKKIGGRTH